MNANETNTMKTKIISKLESHFHPEYLNVINESDQHSGPPGRESHFRVVIVSAAFDGLSRVRRQQSVYTVLATEMQSGIHALGLQCLTPEEWKSKPNLVDSPSCAKGHKHR